MSELCLDIMETNNVEEVSFCINDMMPLLSNTQCKYDKGQIRRIVQDIVESMNGKPLLVAYWFRHDAERIEKRVPCVRLDTDDAIARWNRGEISVALIHPASAGHGLNLQSGGSTLVWFGITWSLELYQQTVARLYRQGQTAKTLVVQHIIAEGTIDERILRALKRKDKTQAALIEAVKAEVTS